MATHPIGSTSSPLADVLARVLQHYDRDGDSRLSSQEFGSFLAESLRAGGERTNSTFAPGTAAGGAGAPVGLLEGFDPGKLSNPSHQSLKYQVGRILQQYPNSPQGLRDALPAIQALVPEVRITGSSGDKLDFGAHTGADGERIGVVDVLRAASIGGAAWQWAPIQ